MRIKDDDLKTLLILANGHDPKPTRPWWALMLDALVQDLRDARNKLSDIAHAPADATREDLIERAWELWEEES